MRFSVLVPVYNVEKYLEQCLDTLVGQTFKDFEVLLTDDGSTDKSGAICDKYAERYPKIFKVFHKKNEGLMLTRRFGLKKAQGEYIVFVDSDDYVSPKLLEVLDATIGKYACDMVLYNFYRFVEGEGELTPVNVSFPNETVFVGEAKKELYAAFIFDRVLVNIWIKAVRRDIIDTDADYKYWNAAKAEDVIQTFPLFDKAEKIVFIDKPLYYYRKNPGSMTLNIKSSDFDDYIKCAERTLEYLKRWEMYDASIGSFAAKQVVFFYNYLRLAYEINKTSFIYGLERLLNNKMFLAFCEDLDIQKVHKRLRVRIKIFKKYMINKKALALRRLIAISNLLSR